MRRVCLVVLAAAAAVVAQDKGFVNPRLLRADLLKSPKPSTTVVNPKDEKCIRVDPIERIVPPKDFDKKMVIEPKGPSGDDKMIIPSPPFCRDSVVQGLPKN